MRCCLPANNYFPKNFKDIVETWCFVICSALRDLVPFVQIKKREKHPWRSIKINTPPWVFFMFFNLYKCYQIVQRTTYTSTGNNQDGRIASKSYR